MPRYQRRLVAARGDEDADVVFGSLALIVFLEQASQASGLDPNKTQPAAIAVQSPPVDFHCNGFATNFVAMSGESLLYDVGKKLPQTRRRSQDIALDNLVQGCARLIDEFRRKFFMYSALSHFWDARPYSSLPQLTPAYSVWRACCVTVGEALRLPPANLEATLILRHDLPELTDLILALSLDHPSLREALNDYELACSSENDETLSSELRAEWANIRKELVREIERQARRISATPDQQRTIE
ncbi:hypothetical protein SAMN05421757_12012 [Tropicimonas sediminicola]|uniref:Uncharacterized protein n=1 Tax=Tropicimonas sediminicola TaxID=1031541 RepID=A0A239MJB4_9RHOB|nr:hypothetical protein SAMN05421757_12012 [Tropicimonas sediminicola]